MKVCVTGGAGYIGAVIVSQLLQQGFEVVVYDKCLFGGESLLAYKSPQFRLVPGDIRDRDLLQSTLCDVDVVVHLAALVGEEACSLDSEMTQVINLTGAEQVLTLAEESGVKRFIFISTCSNYGVSSAEALADEKSPLNPLTVYAETKVAIEKKILESSYSMKTTIFRFGTICGLSPRMRFDLLVNDMARAVALDLPLQIYSPEAYRPFLHVQDAAGAVIHCLSAEEKLIDKQVFNVISENYQKAELMQLVQKHFPEKEIEIVKKDADLRDYRVSAEQIKTIIGFSPSFTVEQAFLETVNAVKGNVFRNPLWSGHSSVPESIETITC